MTPRSRSNVTSLDVIHSFWAYQLEVKADANPLEKQRRLHQDEQLGSFEVRCSELCGIWHGAMFNSGKVVSQSAFMNWATSTETKNAQNTKRLATVRVDLRARRQRCGGWLLPPTAM